MKLHPITVYRTILFCIVLCGWGGVGWSALVLNVIILFSLLISGWTMCCISGVRFLSLAWSKFRLCLANHRTGYFGVSCRGMTSCPLYVSPLFGNLILNGKWSVNLTYRWRFFIVPYPFRRYKFICIWLYLVRYWSIISYLPYFRVSNAALYTLKYSFVHSFSVDVALTL